MRRIGVFMPGVADDPEFQAFNAAFLQRLAELGWAAICEEAITSRIVCQAGNLEGIVRRRREVDRSRAGEDHGGGQAAADSRSERAILSVHRREERPGETETFPPEAAAPHRVSRSRRQGVALRVGTPRAFSRRPLSVDRRPPVMTYKANELSLAHSVGSAGRS